MEYKETQNSILFKNEYEEEFLKLTKEFGVDAVSKAYSRDIHLPEHCNLKQAMELSDIEIPLFLIDMQEETDEVYEDEEIEI